MKNNFIPHGMSASLRTIITAVCLLLLAPGSRAEEEDSASPVDVLMGRVSRDLKKLSRQFDNEAARASSLELVDNMIKANAEAATLVPESVGDRSGEERDKYLARYREGMADLGNVLVGLKAALEANDTGKAEALVDEAYALRKQYHEELL